MNLLILLFTILLLNLQSAWAGEIISPGKIAEIHVLSTDLPMRTAAENLQGFIKLKSNAHEVSIVTDVDLRTAPSAATILLGTTTNSPLFARWLKEGRLSIGTSESSGDAYEMAVLDGCIVVNGANPRAVLYGAFELEDVIAEYGGVPMNLARRASPSLGLRLLHPRMQGGFKGYRQSDFEFLARCGGNVAHLTHDWQGEKTVFNFVPSKKFPKAVEETILSKNRERLHQYLDWCRLYGLGGALWLCEIPCQGGPWVPEKDRKAFLEKFPSNCLSDTGTYQGKVLCLAHPLVEQEYRRMVRQFLTDFPGVSMFLVFTLDAGGELCDPSTCSRHHGVSKLTQYNRLLALMAEEGRKVRPDFQVFSVGWGWNFRGDRDFFPQQAALPAGTGLTTMPDGEAWSFDRKTTDFLIKSRSETREHQQTFLGYDIFFWGDDTVFREIKDGRYGSGLGITKLYDFPLGMAAKLHRWQSLGADGFFDQWGTTAEYVPCNAIAMRELVFHPENAAPDRLNTWAQSLAARRFGTDAAPHVLAAWKEIEVSQQIQSDYAYYWHRLRPAWSGPVLSCPLTVEALKAVTLTGAEPSKPLGTQDYAPLHDDVARAEALAPALRDAADHFAKALVHLQAALPLLQGKTNSTFDHWYQPEMNAPARLTPSQTIQEEIISVRLQERVQRRMSRFFQSWALVKSLGTLEASGQEAALKTLEQIRAEDEASSQAESVKESLHVVPPILHSNANK